MIGSRALPRPLLVRLGLLAFPVGVWAASCACDDARKLTITAGDHQTGPAGAPLTTAVRVHLADPKSSKSVAGVVVTFAPVETGGSVAPTSTTTDGNGDGSATWTLPTAAGIYHLRATGSYTPATQGDNEVTFEATAVGGAAAKLARSGADPQTTTVGSDVPQPPAALVSDQFDNPVSGAVVTFTVATGGGTVRHAATDPPAATAQATSDATGVARLGGWTAGTAAGLNTVTAVLTGTAAAAITFTATAVGASAVSMAIAAGDNQLGTVGTAVGTAPTVLALDAFGNPAPGASITFAIGSGGGQIGGGTSVLVGTGPDGKATAPWILGTAPGANTVTAASPGLTGSPVTFHATATAGPGTTVAISQGDNQTAGAGALVSVRPAVLVSDAFGNPVGGVIVTFAVATGGGSVTGATPQSSGPGIATVGGWRLGPAPGANTLTATAAGIATVLTFHATGSNAAPVLTSIQPNSTFPGASLDVVINGSGICLAPTINASTIGVSNVAVNTPGTQITAHFDVPNTLIATVPVTITCGGLTSNAVSLEVI